jgi:hypothetical protein
MPYEIKHHIEPDTVYSTEEETTASRPSALRSSSGSGARWNAIAARRFNGGSNGPASSGTSHLRRTASSTPTMSLEPPLGMIVGFPQRPLDEPHVAMFSTRPLRTR